MYTQRNLLLSGIASKSNFKPELSTIAFFGDRTVATDSFRLVEIKADGEPVETPTLFKAKDTKQRVKLEKEIEFNTDYLKEEFGLKPVEGFYPEIDKILKPAFSNEDVIELSIDAKLLLETLQVFTRANKDNGVTLKVPTTKGKGITIQADGIRAIVMPRNSNK